MDSVPIGILGEFELGQIRENDSEQEGHAEQQKETVTDSQCDESEIPIDRQVGIGCRQD